MSDEAEIGSAGTSDSGGRLERGCGESAPLQSRAQFLQNWEWSSVTQINRGLCERGGAQRGVNSETHAAAAEEWEKQRGSTLTLLETFQFLKSCHRRAPFLFFNGNTFAEIVRLQDDGRVVWRPDGTESELIALPESLVREAPREGGGA
jgi:hypothetical protein